ncbi:MAG: LruC domain-containing protein, partial [Bacteroidales bacterium]
LPGGRVTIKSFNASSMEDPPNAVLVVREGGELVVNSTFGIDTYNISNFGTTTVGGDFALRNGATLYNEGKLIANSLGTYFEITNNSQLFNSGEINTEHLRINSNTSLMNDIGGAISTNNYSQSNGTVVNNHGELSVSTKLGATSDATLNNHCFVTAEESELSGFNITLESGSLWLTQTLKLNNTVIEMMGGSIFIANDVTNVWNGVIKSTSQSWSLLKTTGDVTDLRYTGISELNGKIEWVHEKLAAGTAPNGIGLYQDRVKGGATLVAEQSINIEGNSCNKSLGQIVGEEPNPDDPESPVTSATYFPSESGWATYAFEDNWPNKGDYDLNDLVLKFRVTQNLNEGGKVKELLFDYQVVAVGALYKIAAAFQLDNILAEQVASVERQPLAGIELDAFTVGENGTEPGVDLAVIPIINNAKRVVSHSNEYLNTEDDVPFISTPTEQLKIIFTAPIAQEELTMANFNFFIAVNSRGREIHLPGYLPTSKFDPNIALEGELHPSDIYKDSEGMMWGLMLPVKFDYPIEMKNITSVYNKFVPWANSGGVEYLDWYQDISGYRNKSYIYSHSHSSDEPIGTI